MDSICDISLVVLPLCIYCNIHGVATTDGTTENTEDIQYSAFYHGEMDDSTEVRSYLTCSFHNKVQR